jgi:hypothetical protein
MKIKLQSAPAARQWRCFLDQGSQRLVGRNHPAGLRCRGGGPIPVGQHLLADDEQRGDLRQRMLADLVVDLLIAQVDLDAQAGARRRTATTLAYSSPSR